MSSTLETYTLDMLQPAQYPGDARIDACYFGPSQTIAAGTAIGIKTSDTKAYTLNGTTGTNAVQTLNFANSPVGTFNLLITDATGIRQLTGPITYSATIATLKTNIQTAIDQVIPQVASTSQIVASGTLVTAVALTYSGVKYAATAQPLIVVDAGALTAGTVAISTTTAGGLTDGTGTFVGFCQYNIETDASSKVYFTSTASGAVASYRTPAYSTAPIFTSGIFDPLTVSTRALTAEVDTFTASSPTTADVYTITITFPDLATYAISATVGATQTATAIDALLIAAWNADPVASQYAVASGTTTLIMTSVKTGFTMSLAGTVAGTGTIAKVVTTAQTGRSLADVLTGNPGAHLLQNGFWKLP